MRSTGVGHAAPAVVHRLQEGEQADERIAPRIVRGEDAPWSRTTSPPVRGPPQPIALRSTFIGSALPMISPAIGERPALSIE